MALRDNTTGHSNTAVGFYSLYKSTNGIRNTAIGLQSLFCNTTGSSNTATGFNALFRTTTGSVNTAAGYSALEQNTSGSYNTAYGYRALYHTTTGDRNIALGANAGDYLFDGSNNVYIGNQGRNTESNTMRIGNSSDHTRTFISGINGIAPSGGANTVVIDGNGQLGTISSSRRYKRDIRDMGEASLGLLDLRPVTFRYKKEHAPRNQGLQYGLIAEEVTDVYPELVQYDADGNAQSVLYHLLPSMLLNELQKQAEIITQLEMRLSQLEAKKNKKMMD